MIENLWEQSSLKDALAMRVEERAMARMARLMLQSRSGPLNDDIVTALDTADGATLETIGEHLASMRQPIRWTKSAYASA